MCRLAKIFWAHVRANLWCLNPKHLYDGHVVYTEKSKDSGRWLFKTKTVAVAAGSIFRDDIRIVKVFYSE
jgi:hypothetical protein